MLGAGVLLALFPVLTRAALPDMPKAPLIIGSGQAAAPRNSLVAHYEKKLNRVASQEPPFRGKVKRYRCVEEYVSLADEARTAKDAWHKNEDVTPSRPLLHAPTPNKVASNKRQPTDDSKPVTSTSPSTSNMRRHPENALGISSELDLQFRQLYDEYDEVVSGGSFVRRRELERLAELRPRRWFRRPSSYSFASRRELSMVHPMKIPPPPRQQPLPPSPPPRTTLAPVPEDRRQSLQPTLPLRRLAVPAASALPTAAPQPATLPATTTERATAANCAKMAELASQFGISDTVGWARSNCGLLQVYAPLTSCDQIVRFIASCNN